MGLVWVVLGFGKNIANIKLKWVDKTHVKKGYINICSRVAAKTSTFRATKRNEPEQNRQDIMADAIFYEKKAV